MKALVYYGPRDIRVEPVPDPKPGKGEVLVKVRACGICGSDIHGYLGITGRRIAPMIMGHEFSGVVEAAGEEVENINQGDRVVIQPVNYCGSCELCHKRLTNLCINKKFLGVMDVNGAMAEHICVDAKQIHKLPDSLSFVQGALAEPIAVAYRALNRVASVEGKDVLIIGAGFIGLITLGIAKKRKAGRIIAADLSDFRLRLAEELGADMTVNPSKENAVETIMDVTGGRGVDISVEAVGSSAPVQTAMSSLKTGGTGIWIGNSAKMINVNMQEIVTRELNVQGTYIYTDEEFEEVLEFIAAGGVDIGPLISKVITLEEAPGMFEKLGKGADELIKVVINC